jgi:5'-methylthioadenosine nucleosidase
MAASMGKSVGKVCFLVAMEQESAPLIAALKLTKRATSGPAPVIVHEGTYKGAAVVVYNPGLSEGKSLVGTDFATLATFLAAERDAPDLLINAGTCGGFRKRGGAVGDVYCVTTFQHHDRRVPIPGYDAMCVGLRAAHPTPKLVAALGVKAGPCTTGNSLDCSPTDSEVIEVVTDIVDGEHPTQDEFLANLQTASTSLQAVLPKVLDFVLGKPLSDL